MKNAINIDHLIAHYNQQTMSKPLSEWLKELYESINKTDAHGLNMTKNLEVQRTQEYLLSIDPSIISWLETHDEQTKLFRYSIEKERIAFGKRRAQSEEINGLVNRLMRWKNKTNTPTLMIVDAENSSQIEWPNSASKKWITHYAKLLKLNTLDMISWQKISEKTNSIVTGCINQLVTQINEKRKEKDIQSKITMLLDLTNELIQSQSVKPNHYILVTNASNQTLNNSSTYWLFVHVDKVKLTVQSLSQKKEVTLSSVDHTIEFKNRSVGKNECNWLIDQWRRIKHDLKSGAAEIYLDV